AGLSSQPSGNQAVLSDDAPQGASSSLGAGRRTRGAFRRSTPVTAFASAMPATLRSLPANRRRRAGLVHSHGVTSGARDASVEVTADERMRFLRDAFRSSEGIGSHGCLEEFQ